MPQMAPINWLFLFIMFSMIFIMFNSMNYFSFKYPVKSSTTQKIMKKINWKW
uniref:ATP synthase F0 subunit 8 n=1 Tax=Sternolophus rufipes TaxID=1383104 RepID=UPI0023F508E5|nr:ATP synthase F0 subunit 8 [Sternolophus rufipes]WED07053.1 ATP synthase F0 subunit 8 [Sternolophus rufipes]